MRRKFKNIFISILTVLFSALMLFACQTISNDNKYALSKTEIAIAVGDVESITISCDGELYTGPINWISENTGVATVYQGVIKGIKAGETEVKAVIKSANVTLKATVKVDAKIDATLEMKNAYAGGGDINITATAAELPVGATGTPTKVLSPSGQDVTNLLKSSVVGDFLTNDIGAPLQAGIYTVTYKLKSMEAEGATTRNVRVLTAENVEDLLVLDPIDGTEPLSGKVFENNIEPAMNLNKENPGEYVTYTDEDKVGYGGIVDNTTAYRMYGKRTTITGKNLWFAFNLPYTTSALWTNLDNVPDTATIEVWVRGFYRGEGETEFQPARLSTGMYMYKMLSGERQQLSTAGYTVMHTENGWSKISYSIGNNRELLNGMKNLAFTGSCTGHFVQNAQGSYERLNVCGEYYYDLYSVELNLGTANTITNYTGELEKDYFGSWSGLFNEVDVTLTKNGSVIDCVEGEKLVKGLYDVTYELKNGDVVFDTINKSLCVGAINMFETANGVTRPSWGGYIDEIKAIEYADIPAEVGAPQDSAFAALNKGMVTAVTSTNQVMPGIDISSLINSSELKDNTIIALYVYTPAAVKDNGSTVSSNTYGGAWLQVSDGMLGAATGASGKTYSGGANYTNKAISLIPNSWNKITFTIAELKALQNKAELKEITYLYVYCRWTEKNAPMYLYSMEIDGEVEPYEIELDDSFRDYILVKEEAFEHETVKITLKSMPNELSLIRIYGNSGNLLHTFSMKDGRFTMPAENVRIVLEKVEDIPDIYQYNKASLKLSGVYNEFGEYTIQIKKDGLLLKEGTDYTLDSNLNVTIQKGEYEVVYTFTEYEKSLSCTLYFGESENVYLATGSSLVYANFTGLDYSVVSMNRLTSHGGADISSKPKDAKADYNAVVSITPKDWAFNVGFDITDILANIDEYDNHYLTLYVASYFYNNAATGAHLTTLNGTREYVWGSGNANASSVIPLVNFASGSTAGWVAFNVEMSAIKAMAQTNQGKNYIVFNLAPNKATPVYIYSLEITEKASSIEGYLPDGTCYYNSAKTANTITTVSMNGLTSHGGANISQKPANAKANYTSCLSVTPAENHWETAIGFDITDILANINQYEGKYLTLFAASYFYGSRGAYLSGFNASQNKVIGITQAEYATGGMAFDCASGSTGGWKEYKIPVSTLKIAAQNKAGANYITWHFRTNAKTPVYVYSLEITD